jgi:Fe-S-cluster-containing dehydrogenase component
MTEMAIFQDVDKCMRCNGCVVACKREWKLKYDSIGVHKVGIDQRLAIKSQKRVDMGPFVRYTCWHCPNPPCASACPKNAIIKRENGAVDIDRDACDPVYCSSKNNGQYPCQTHCQRGGFPKVGPGYTDLPDDQPKAIKCTLCYGRAGDTTAADALPSRSKDYKSQLTLPSGGTLPHSGVINELKHEPACVSTCPAKAMMWDTKANIVAFLNDKQNGYWPNNSRNFVGNGSMYWGSKKVLVAPPKADPLVEDHLTPMVSSLTSGPIAKAALIPTLVVGGLLAVSARRAANENAATGEEV